MNKYYIFFIALTFSAYVHGQADLSLSDAIQLGLQRNYGILIESKNIETAQNNNQWGTTGILPTISLNASSNNSVQSSAGERFFAGNTFPFEQGNQRYYSQQPAAQVNWTLLGNKAFITKRRLEQLEAQSMQNAQVVVANTIQAIIAAYYLAVLENDRLEEFRKQLALSSDKFNYIKTKQELGGAGTSEVLLEENNYLIDSSNYINQQLSLNNSFRNLNAVLAEPDLNKKYILTDPLEVDPSVYSLDDLKEKAATANVDLKQIFLSQSILELATKESQSDRLPALSFNGGYNWNRSVTDLKNATSSNPDFVAPTENIIFKNSSASANFTLSFTLFDGNRINRSIENAILQEDIGNLRTEQLKLSISKDLLDAYDQYTIRRQLYEINNRRKEAALINLSNSEERFRNGTINSFDYRDVQNNYLSAAILELQAVYNLIDSKISLMRLTGGLIENYQ
jgi:outer membrane protein